MPAAPAEFIRALRRRDPLRADGATDALRLLDGAGDGRAFDGLFIDDFAGRWLVQTTFPGQTPPDWLRTLPTDDAPRSIYWKRLDSRGEHQQPPSFWAGEEIAGPFDIREGKLWYRIDFQNGYSQGIFLDQRDNRRTLRERVRPGMSVLNCFAYTCAFSVVAAAAGARTVSVDLSRASLDWGKENFRLNGLDPEGHEFRAADVSEAIRHRAKRGAHFDFIVLDPPTFSRDRKGKVFRAEDDFGTLAALAATLLAPSGAMLCSSNSRRLTEDGFRRLVLSELLGGGGRWHTELTPMPVDFTGEPYLRAVWISRSEG